MFRILAVVAVVALTACSTQGPSDTAKLLTYDDLITTPGYAWFPAEMSIYTPDQAMVDTIAKYYNPATQKISIFMSPTCACTGSKRLFPRTIKALVVAGVNIKDIEFWSMRTISDMHPYSSKVSLTEIPTVVVLNNGVETGRIEESNFTETNADTLIANVIAKR
ncbi:MAG: hypothetical protein HYX66_07615 [Ignavibacteria bacterium]|nr:hypothetical protein [Ignavibacteria bacterium]